MTVPPPLHGTFDVIVVGAGLAGLRAALDLHRAGHRVLVLEARDRVGGRTWTVALEGSPFDAGGQWTGPGQPRMAALIEQLGLRTETTFHTGRKQLDLEGRRSSYTGSIPRISIWKLLTMQLAIWRIEWLCRKVPLPDPWTSPMAPEWDGMTAGQWLRQKVGDPDVVALSNSAVRVIMGADLDELSLLHFLTYMHSGGGITKLIETHGGNQDRSIVGGAQQLSEGMRRQLPQVELSTPVRALIQDEAGVTVRSDRGEVRARRVIMAIPLPLLQRITFEPPLPADRQALHNSTRMGATVKCQAVYERAFWREAGWSGEVVCTQGPLTVVFDGKVADGAPALLVFLCGAPARDWAARDPQEQQHIVLKALTDAFGPDAAKPVHLRITDWSQEEYSGGAPIGLFPQGVLSTHGPALRAPVGNIHWAGTETARESMGFMEGALESGERAAAEVAAALAPA